MEDCQNGLFNIKQEVILNTNQEDNLEVTEMNSNIKQELTDRVKYCFLCGKRNGQTIMFIEHTLNKARYSLKVRQKHKFKYHDIILPNECAGNGYHRNCYQVFTALKKKYRTPETFEKEVCSKEESVSLDFCCTETVVGSECPSEPSYLHSSTTESSTTLQTTSIPERSIKTDSGARTLKYKTLCIICNRKDKREGRNARKSLKLHQTDTNKFKSSVLPHIEGQDEYTELINKLDNFSPTTIYYHMKCKHNLLYKIISSRTPKKDWHYYRECCEIAFNEISHMIKEDVIKKGCCYLLVLLHEVYVDVLETMVDTSVNMDTTMTEYNLEKKIIRTFGKQIRILTFRKNKVLAPMKVQAIDYTVFENLETEHILQKAALILRKSIMQVERTDLPAKNITAQHLISGEASIPEQLQDFYFTLLGGCSEKRKKSSKCTRQVNSCSQDVIFGVHNGQVKTPKHIMLGIILKSLTSDSEIIDIINRYGHCISYQDLEKLEAVTAYSYFANPSLSPENIKDKSFCFAGVAFDNADNFVETSSGKEISHETVGIIYQNVNSTTVEELKISEESTKTEEVFIVIAPDVPIESERIIEPDMNIEPAINIEPDKALGHDILQQPEDPLAQTSSNENMSLKNKKTKRRKTLKTKFTEDIPDAKKPKMTNGLQVEVNDTEATSKVESSTNWQLYTEIDNMWMISHMLKLPDVPMWVGFNSRIYNDDSSQQLVSYITPNNASKASTSSVLETMERTKKIAEDLHQPYIQVTYNLMFAEAAFQIQATEKPTYDNLFIHLGPLHIMKAYFKAIGNVISDCGLTNVMVESNLLPNGSVNGFLDGKPFNSCQRLHSLVALGLEILQFKSFLQNDNYILTNEMKEEVRRLQACEISSFEMKNEELKELMDNYNIYKQQCLNGKHGKTSQFYSIYINLIHHYLNLSRSIRTGDFDLFITILPEITNMFFMCNLHNYTRWTVKYHENLLKVADTHPDLYKGFKKGFFGIKRTSKPFSRQPVDLVLEQSKKVVSGNLTNSISSDQRCAENQLVRATIISHVYMELGIQTNEDVSAELNLHNIRKNTEQLHKFIATFERFINPFTSQVPQDQLIHISTGKSASPPVEAFLLNIEENGDHLRKAFISECSSDSSRFERAINKISIDNFSKDQLKKKVRVGGKYQELKMQRDSFGRTLEILMEQDVEISEFLSYPITPVPLSMCHWDGSMCKIDKSALIECLHNEDKNDQPDYIDVFIIDGFFLLQTMKNVPKTFGNISKKLLQMVTQLQAQRIDVIFEHHFKPSIKNFQPGQRLEHAQFEYTITGPDQNRPSDFAKELNNPNFKEALVDFFISDWAADEMATFICNKVIIVNFRECHSFAVDDSNNVVSSVDELLSCPEHEDAVTKIVFHACNIGVEANIAIRSPDTDIAAIMLGNMSHVKEGSSVWMLTSSGGNSRYVDLTKLHAELGETLSQSLPGFHAMTGCDYNPAIFKPGKLKAYNILKNNQEYQKAFMKFGSSLIENYDQKNVFDVIQRFICDIYDAVDIIDVNTARMKLFSGSHKGSEANLKKLRNFDASSLPPCKRELFQQFLRANYICTIWKNTHRKLATVYKPENNGWVLLNGQYHFKWFEGDQLPSYVYHSLQTLSETDCEDGIDDHTEDWSSEEDNEDTDKIY